MKKIISLVLMILIVLGINVSIYAASSCNVNIVVSKSEYSENEEFVADINISNIKSDNGIIAFSATLEYDKNSLSLEEMQGVNGWSDPYYNEANGKFVTDRNSRLTNDETILKIRFKVKEGSNTNLSIAVKDATVGDGSIPNEVNGNNTNISIKNDSVIATETPTPTSTPITVPTAITTPTETPTKIPTSTPKVTQGPIQTPNSTMASGRLPQTGISDINIVLVVIASFIIVSIVFYIKIKRINRKK